MATYIAPHDLPSTLYANENNWVFDVGSLEGYWIAHENDSNKIVDWSSNNRHLSKSGSVPLTNSLSYYYWHSLHLPSKNNISATISNEDGGHLLSDPGIDFNMNGDSEFSIFVSMSDNESPSGLSPYGIIGKQDNTLVSGGWRLETDGSNVLFTFDSAAGYQTVTFANAFRSPYNDSSQQTDIEMRWLCLIRHLGGEYELWSGCSIDDNENSAPVNLFTGSNANELSLTNSHRFRIGRSTFANNFVEGRFLCCAVFSRCLTDPEVRSLNIDPFECLRTPAFSDSNLDIPDSNLSTYSHAKTEFDSWLSIVYPAMRANNYPDNVEDFSNNNSTNIYGGYANNGGLLYYSGYFLMALLWAYRGTGDTGYLETANNYIREYIDYATLEDDRTDTPESLKPFYTWPYQPGGTEVGLLNEVQWAKSALQILAETGYEASDRSTMLNWIRHNIITKWAYGSLSSSRDRWNQYMICLVIAHYLGMEPELNTVVPYVDSTNGTFPVMNGGNVFDGSDPDGYITPYNGMTFYDMAINCRSIIYREPDPSTYIPPTGENFIVDPGSGDNLRNTRSDTYLYAGTTYYTPFPTVHNWKYHGSSFHTPGAITYGYDYDDGTWATKEGFEYVIVRKSQSRWLSSGHVARDYECLICDRYIKNFIPAAVKESIYKTMQHY
ncbi:hypothetical protein GF312_02010, partial [Candidatus Poribacteria bacterium]|nr:hypothetical protein [Candidatus Poribacteria bacterium]